MFDADNVYAVGGTAANGVIYKWNGSAWSLVHVLAGANKNYKGIWASSESDIHAVSRTGFYTHFDGATWTDVQISAFDLEAIHGILATPPIVVSGVVPVAEPRPANEYESSAHTTAPTTSPVATNWDDVDVTQGAISMGVDDPYNPAQPWALLDLGFGPEPTTMAITMPTETKIRVTFSQLVDNDGELINMDNWSVAPIDGGVWVGLSNPTPENADPKVNWVEFDLDREITIATYRITVAQGKIKVGDGYIVSPDNVKDFIGLGTMPSLYQAIPIAETEIELTFSEEMDGTLELTKPSSYDVNGGLKVIHVTRTAARKVVIRLDQAMERDQLYEITVVG